MQEVIFMFTVYKHTSPSGKVYIGITSQPLKKRWSYGYGYQNNDHFWKAIQKYGWNNFTHEIIAAELTKQEACNMEQELIVKYNSTNPDFGYNLSKGGELIGYGVPCSDEKKEKIRQSRLREKHWFYGKHLSEEHRRKISEKSKGRHPSDETKVKQKDCSSIKRESGSMCRNQYYL